MSKRAIELQFHWIFILIAGAVILAFFFSVVQKQRALSEEKLSITLAGQMDAIFTGAIESKGTTQSLVTPKPGIAFSCSKVCECNYHIGRKATEFRDKLLFAPAMIKDQDAIAWAIEWKLPFRIANFLLLTNPTIKYYIVYERGDQLSEQLYRRVNIALPKELNQVAIGSLRDITRLTPQGDAQTRLVFLGTQEPDLRSLNLDFAREDVSGVWINADAITAVFYEKTDPDELEFSEYPSVLAGDTTVYGAIFAADHQMYECVMKRAFEKLGVIAQVQAKRAQELKNTVSAARPECAYVLQDLQTVAQKAEQVAGAQALRDAEAAISVIRGAQSALQLQNTNLIKQSCPELY